LTSQTRAVLSQDAVTMREPSELKAADQTIPSCFNGGVSGWSFLPFQTRAVPSKDAVLVPKPFRSKLACTTFETSSVGTSSGTGEAWAASRLNERPVKAPKRCLRASLNLPNSRFRSRVRTRSDPASLWSGVIGLIGTTCDHQRELFFVTTTGFRLLASTITAEWFSLPT
jgi:hypothetical protein